MTKSITTLVAVAAFSLAQAEDSTVSPSPSPTATSTPSSTPEKELLTLTPDRLQKLIRIAREKGEDLPITQAVSQALGLPKGTQVLGQISSTFGKVKMIFSLASNLDGYIFGAITEKGIFVFYVDESLNFISAAKMLTGKDWVTVSDDALAKRQLATILDRWARTVDKEEAKKAEPSQ
jgi:hypothetical protein